MVEKILAVSTVLQMVQITPMTSMGCSSSFNNQEMPALPNSPDYPGAKDIINMARAFTNEIAVETTQVWNALPDARVPARIPIYMAK